MTRSACPVSAQPARVHGRGAPWTALTCTSGPQHTWTESTTQSRTWGYFLAGASEVVLSGKDYLGDVIPLLRIAIEDACFGCIRTGSCAVLPSTFRTTTCLEWERFGTTPYYSVHPVPTWRAGVAAEARRRLDIAGVGIRHMVIIQAFLHDNDDIVKPLVAVFPWWCRGDTK
ncbi:hypothetical protein EJB05_46326, partial [Eragrostis curvula]